MTGNAADKDLAGELGRESRFAGEMLYRRHYTSIERYCRCLMHDGDSAKDAAHETFIAAMGAIATLREYASVRAWLFRIARNQCLMMMRRSSRLLRLEDSDDLWETQTPQSLVLEGELQKVVRDAVDHLKPIYREALVLREFGELSYQEIAEITGASFASVKFRLHRAREALADTLAEYLDERNEP